MAKRLTTLMLTAAGVIFALGLVMIFNTSSAEVLDLALEKSTHHALGRQIAFGVVGALVAWGVLRVGHKRLLQYSPFLLLVGIGLLVLVLIPGFGVSANGARRWLRLLGSGTLQPSELIKYLVPLYLVHHYVTNAHSILSWRGFIRGLAPAVVAMGFVVLEPDNGTVAILTIILCVVFVVTQVPLRYWALPALVLGLVGGAIAYNMPYVSARLQSYLHPDRDLQGKGHQPHQAKIAAGSGQLWGKGPGQSLQKLSYLPEAQNDYIAAIFAEEFGFVGVLSLILLYMAFCACGFDIAHSALHRDPQGYCVAAVVTFIIGFQAFLNLGVVSGLLPSTGLNLPFFSQGGSSLVANMGGVGLLLSVSYQNPRRRHQSPPKPSQTRR